MLIVFIKYVTRSNEMHTPTSSQFVLFLRRHCSFSRLLVVVDEQDLVRFGQRMIEGPGDIAGGVGSKPWH